MIAHVVLFKPKPALTADERQTFVDALQHALTNIDLITRATIGRRVTLGRKYDQQNNVDFPFAAILEFATEADLRAYLEHPAHMNLGREFYLKADASLVFDYECSRVIGRRSNCYGQRRSHEITKPTNGLWTRCFVPSCSLALLVADYFLNTKSSSARTSRPVP